MYFRMGATKGKNYKPYLVRNNIWFVFTIGGSLFAINCVLQDLPSNWCELGGVVIQARKRQWHSMENHFTSQLFLDTFYHSLLCFNQFSVRILQGRSLLVKFPGRRGRSMGIGLKWRSVLYNKISLYISSTAVFLLDCLGQGTSIFPYVQEKYQMVSPFIFFFERTPYGTTYILSLQVLEKGTARREACRCGELRCMDGSLRLHGLHKYANIMV